MSTDSSSPAWTRVSALFHEALERPASDRLAFIEHEAAGDPALVREVTSLLAAHARADDFIEQSAPAIHTTDGGTVARVALAAGTRVGPYNVVRVLGEGGMGVVYLAQDTRLDRTVALKAVSPAVADKPGQRERLAREARAAAVLSHPGIATVYALEEFDGQLYMASEYVSGPSLREELESGAFGARRAHAVMRELAQALHAAHTRGIVHRDLKPENVVRAANGTLKILDFGLSRGLDAAPTSAPPTAEGAVLGTPAYMSPEQIRGHTVDARADLFALGTVAFELTTGVNPFDAGHPAATLARVLEYRPVVFPADSGVQAGDSFTQRFAGVVQQCLEKAPDARVPTAAALLDAVNRVEDDEGESAPTARPASESGEPHTARWWWRFHQVAAIAAHVVLLIPLWGVRDLVTTDRGRLLILSGVLAVAVSGALRLHLLFAARHYPDHWPDLQRRAVWWIRGAELGYAVILLTAGVIALRAAAPAILLVASAASVAVASLVVDPATTRAAWRGQV